MKYEFSNQTENSATISLQWEKISIPLRVETDYINIQLASFRKELRTEKGFIWQSWNQAAQWCLQRNTNLEEALLWADSATSTGFGGDKSFLAWSTKTQILNKLGRTGEAFQVMNKALSFGSMIDLHQYGRQLSNLKMYKDAFDIFKMNHDKNPGQFTTLMGLTRGYAGLGDLKNALRYAGQALSKAPDEQNKKNVQAIIDKLKEGKDINQ
ncbi:MAG: hypothetical protein IPH18_17175 [Chitinophagaceae bacterium]|nr:hypothetical protein [Chitinophagaceae bacterium]